MNTGLLFFIMIYLIVGFALYPLAKRFPKRFGPVGELMEAMLLFVGGGGGIEFLLCVVLIGMFWPIAVIGGIFVSGTSLEYTLKRHGGEPAQVGERMAGAEALCLTDLKPSGKIDVDGQRYDATCLSGFIPRGSTVRIVKQQGFNVVVERNV